MIGMRSYAATSGLNFDGIVSRVAPIGDGIVSRVAPPVDPGSDGGPLPAGCVSPMTEPGFWTGPALSGTCRGWAFAVATIRAALKSANQHVGSRKRIAFLLVSRSKASSLLAYRPIPTFPATTFSPPLSNDWLRSVVRGFVINLQTTSFPGSRRDRRGACQ